MLTLQQMLNGRTHRDLELIARAHNLPFTRREPKAQGLEQLSQTLHDGAYEKAIPRALCLNGDWEDFQRFFVVLMV